MSRPFHSIEIDEFSNMQRYQYIFEGNNSYKTILQYADTNWNFAYDFKLWLLLQIVLQHCIGQYRQIYICIVVCVVHSGVCGA